MMFALRSFLIAVVLDCKAFHVFKGDLALVITVEDALVGGDVGSSGVELLVHGAVEVHQHLARSDRLQNSVLVIVVHLEQLPNWTNKYFVNSLHRYLLNRPPFSILTTWS
jgi:hypothetical protein